MPVVVLLASCSEPPLEDEEPICDPAQCPITQAAVTPVFQVGVDPDGAPGGMPFVPATEGSAFRVIEGDQGASMVVLSVATNRFDCCVKRVNVRASLTSIDCGRDLGSMDYRRRPLAEGDDGFRYLLSTWLIVGWPGTWEEEQASLTLSLEPYGGGEAFEQTLTVVLNKDRGGNPAPSMKLGTSDDGASGPDAFCALPGAAALNAVALEGGQAGLLLAARSAVLGADVTEVDIDATLTKWVKSNRKCPPPVQESCRMTSVELGRIEGRRHPLVRRDDGRAYALGIPLPLGSEAEWANEVGTLTLSLTPVGGGDTLTSSATFTILPAVR